MPFNKSAVWKIIRDIHPDDRRVRIIGRIVKAEGHMLVVDDSTGVLLINYNGEHSSEIGSIVLVLGELHQRTDGKLILEAEILRTFKKFNFDLYLRTYEIIRGHTSNKSD